VLIRGVAAWVLSALLGLGTTGAAWGADGRRRADEARARYEQATAAYALGKYAEAASLYEQAFELKVDQALLYNAAQAHRLAGNTKRAAELYKSYLRVFPSAAHREEATRRLADLQAAEAREPQPAPAPQPTAVPQPAAAPPTGASAAKPPGLSGAPVVVGSANAPGLSLARPPQPPPEKGAKSGWNRPWLWAGAAALVAVGIGAIVLATRGPRDPNPSWGRLP
jgi:hypothetical protein